MSLKGIHMRSKQLQTDGLADLRKLIVSKERKSVLVAQDNREPLKLFLGQRRDGARVNAIQDHTKVVFGNHGCHFYVKSLIEISC